MSSQKCGYRKPNPKGLKCISNILAVSVEELIFIGDEKKDCETSNRANCKFILINRKDTKNSFCNLKKILDAIYWYILIKWIRLDTHRKNHISYSSSTNYNFMLLEKF